MKLNRNSYWLKSGTFSLLHRLSVVILGTMTFVILVRTLSQNDYGIWMLFISITAIMEVLRNGFIRNPLVKYVNTSNAEEYKVVITSALYLNFFFTVFTSLILVFFSGWMAHFLNAPELDKLMRIYLITNFVLIPFSHFEFIQQSNFTFTGTFISYFLRNALLFLYVLFCHLTSYELSLTTLSYFNAVSIFVSAIVSFVYAKKFLSPITRPHLEWINKLFQYGKYTFGTNVNSMLSKNIDHWLLGHLISPASVAIYNPAIRISNLVEVPTMALSSILFPKIAEVSKENDHTKVKKLYERAVGAILALMIPATVFIFLLSDFIVLLLAGEAYSESAPILRITIFYTLYLPFMRFFGNVLDAVNRPHINFYFVLLMAIMNIVFNYLFISNFGVIGAAYGTMTTFALGFVMNQVYLKTNFDISTFSCVKEAFAFYPLGFSMMKDFFTKKVKSTN